MAGAGAGAALVVARTALYYILLVPIIKLLQVILFLLTPLWAVIAFVLLPVTHLAQVLLRLAMFPFRLQLRDRLEVCVSIVCAGFVRQLKFGLADHLHLPGNRCSGGYPRRRRSPYLLQRSLLCLSH